jgi:oligopeptide transport system substrate-binding protein
MSRMKLWSLIGLVVVASMILASCGTPPPQTVVQTVVVKEPGTNTTVVITATPPPPVKPQRPNEIHVNFGPGDVPTLDPSVAEDTSSITAIEEAYVGLTRLDEVTNELHPGMATSWDISADGLVYTFHLRNDVPWVKWDGKQVVKVQDCDGNDRLVTAKDFEYGILRALNPETASPYAYVLAFVIQGANEYNSGTITDTAQVGVKAIDDFTLEMKFLEPAAYNANIAGLWTAMPIPKWVVEGDDCTEARGEKWIEPGFYQTYGPFTVSEWVHDSTLTVLAWR